jgi:hypothetical protein
MKELDQRMKMKNQNLSNETVRKGRKNDEIMKESDKWKIIKQEINGEKKRELRICGDEGRKDE